MEMPLDKVGLFASPVKRFAFFTVGTALVLRMLQPESLFLKGDPRPSMIWSDDAEAVPVDYLTLSGLVGTLSVLLV